MTGKLVLLASYPKSGNTWVRAFLTAIWRHGAEVDINDLMVRSVSNRDFVDEQLGVPSADLSAQEIARLRPNIYRRVAQQGPQDQRVFLKVHDAHLPASPEFPLPIYPEDIERVVYIVRDPRDVAVSLARHLRTSTDDAIKIMSDRKFQLSFYPRRAGGHIAQFTSSWSAHVESWLNITGIPLLLLRFEDMVRAREASFRSLLEFLHITTSEESFRLALEGTRFNTLQEKNSDKDLWKNQPMITDSFTQGIPDPGRPR